MGFGAGIAAPSRDLLVKRSTPDNATGRVYGVVYSGLDIGQAVAPLLFGTLMDWHRPAQVWLGIALVQGAVVLSDNRALELVGAGELATIGHELVILDHPKLNLVELGKLASVEAVRIERDPKLPAALVEQLRQKATSP